MPKSTVIIIVAALVAAALVAVKVMDWSADRSAPPTASSEAPPATPSRQTEGQAAAPTALISPSFDVVRISRQGTGVIAGRCSPNCEVQVKADGQHIGSATANNKGEWVLIILDPLSPGSRELTLSSRDPGGALAESEDVVIIAVPSPEDVSDDEDEGVVAVLLPKSGIGPSRVLQQPDMSGVATSLQLETIDYDSAGNAVLTGRGEGQTTLLLYLDNEFIGSVWVPPDGRWRFEPKRLIPQGAHVLRLDQVLAEGNVKIRIELPFDRSTPLDLGLQQGQVIVQPGNNLWHIARTVMGGGARFVLLYQANREQIRDPNLIYPGQVFSLPKSNGASPQKIRD